MTDLSSFAAAAIRWLVTSRAQQLWEKEWPWLAIAGAITILWWILLRAFGRSRGQSAAVSTRRPRIEVPGEDQGVFGPLTPALAAQLPESDQEGADFEKLLRQAGVYAPSARSSIYALRFLMLFGALAVCGVLVILAPSEFTIPLLIGGSVVAASLSIIPRLYVYFRRQRRLAQIREGLADMMDMLSMCLGGGLPLSTSLDYVSRNLVSHPALALELQIVRRQAEVGSIRLALNDFANRVDLPEVRQVASVLTRSDQLGTQLSGSLMEQADHFRTMRRQLATMKANRTPVFLSLPLMLCFAPAALILLISPAVLELHDFLRPESGQSILAGNETLNTGRVVRAIDSLDQTAPPPRPAPVRQRSGWTD